MSIRSGLLLAAGLIAATLAQGASASEGANKGTAALQWIEGFECPTPGRPLNVPGLETQTAINSLKSENRNYIQSRREALELALRARGQVQSEIQGRNKPGRRLQKAFDDLDAKINDLGGHVTHSLAQMVMAGYVELAKASLSDPPPASGRHPLSQFTQYGSDLVALARPYGPAAMSVTERWNECVNAANNAYIEEFEAEIIADAEGTSNTSDIAGVYNRWLLQGARNDSPILQQVRSIQMARVEEERREIERRRAERDAEARRILQAQAERELQIAKRYVGHVKAGRTKSAINMLTSDIYLSSPNGNARGKDAVARRMREAADNSAGASMGNPTVGSNYSIYVRVSSSRGSGTMIFGFRNSLISSITLRRN